LKIENIKINSFGTLENKEINLDKNVNIIYGKNESGKSTLLTYIKTAFYGISKNKNGKQISDFDKYKPWSGEEFSGKIKYILDDGSKYEIFRDFNKKNAKIYNDNLEDITKQFNMDKKEGSQFFLEQVGLDENMFTSTIMSGQQEVKLNEQQQNVLVQKIANIAGTGDSNLSYNKAKEKLNKKQLEEVGTERTQGKPINILKSKIKYISEMLEKLNLYKQEKITIEQKKKDLENKIQGQEQRRELIKKISELSEKIRIESEKVNYKNKIKEEKQDEIENLKREKEEITNISRNKKNKNEWYWIINAIMIVLMAISIIALKNKYITYIILTVLTCTLVLEYIIKINKIKRNKDLQKNKIDLLNTKIDFLQKQKNDIEQDIKREKYNLEKEKEEIKNKYNIELYDIENSKNDLEEITSRINEEKIKLNTLEVEEKSIVNKLEDLIKLEEEFATIHEQLKEIEQKNYEINLAKDFLEKAYEKMKKNITPKFTFNLSENIKNITNGKYTNINVNDENGLIVEIQNGEYIPAERLSIGTIDQLYLSLRISMIEEISKEKMPIILDEAFAYFDDERLENILKYLTQKYKQHQLIIFTCTNREKNILDKLNCIYNSVEL
jgi:DNA repair exonuclease SbcCD ATPase subunit